MVAQHSLKDAYEEFVPFYDLFYAEREAEIAFYTSLLEPQHHAVLELGCGTGSIVRAIGRDIAARHGSALRVVGLDRSAEMLRHARERFPDLHWVQGDMSQPPVVGPFDLVICALNTLQMLDSDASVLRTLEASRELLGPRGVFVLDVYNASFAETVDVPLPPLRHRMVRSFTDATGHPFEVLEEATDGAAGDWVQLDWRVMDTSVRPPAQRARLVVRLRHYSPAALERLLTVAGFRVLARFGDVRKSRFDERTSRKQVLICGR